VCALRGCVGGKEDSWSVTCLLHVYTCMQHMLMLRGRTVAPKRLANLTNSGFDGQDSSYFSPFLLNASRSPPGKRMMASPFLISLGTRAAQAPQHQLRMKHRAKRRVPNVSCERREKGIRVSRLLHGSGRCCLPAPEEISGRHGDAAIRGVAVCHSLLVTEVLRPSLFQLLLRLHVAEQVGVDDAAD